MDVIIVDCVIYESKREFNKYIRLENNKSVIVVDYAAIISKLQKSDPIGNTPHPFIIGMAIRNILKNINRKRKTYRIIYSICTPNVETIKNMKNLMFEFFDSIIEINLVSINSDVCVSSEVRELFDKYTIIKNDTK